MAPWRVSCQVSIRRCVSRKIRSSRSTRASGGKPPCDWPTLMLPRVATKRMPMACAASMLSSSRTPLGYRYRWSLLVVQPLSSSSAMATRLLTCTISGVRPAQIGYRARSQPNSSAFCACGMARVRLWYMWWWVLTRPGSTRWPRASITSSAVAGNSAAGPMASIRLSRTKTDAWRSSRDWFGSGWSKVATQSALRMSRVGMARGHIDSGGKAISRD